MEKYRVILTAEERAALERGPIPKKWR
jgi:hypothetical protein